MVSTNAKVETAGDYYWLDVRKEQKGSHLKPC